MFLDKAHLRGWLSMGQKKDPELFQHFSPSKLLVVHQKFTKSETNFKEFLGREQLEIFLRFEG